MAETYYSLTDIVKLCDNLVAAMPSSYANGILAVRNQIGGIPAADVVEVVRCKDCEYWRGANDICMGIGIDFDADGFCCEGEGRDNDEVH